MTQSKRRQIDDLNLIVPVISGQRRRLHLADELQRITEETGT